MAALDSYKVPTTELQAVNVILEAMGEHTVATLASAGEPVDTAIRRLGEASVETQEEGWSFNTDECYEISPVTGGQVVLPANTLKIRQVYFAGGYKKKLVIRSDGGTQKVYDRQNNTFNIGVPVTVNIVVALGFEDLPQAARWYITLKAARRAAAGKLVSSTVYQFTKTDEDQARLRLEQSEDEATHMETMAGNPHVKFMRFR